VTAWNGSYPTFDDDPVRWGLLPPEPMTDAAAEAAAEAEALEALDEWDDADSNAYQARVEAGLVPEVEP
jgi:hypothetical protein